MKKTDVSSAQDVLLLPIQCSSFTTLGGLFAREGISSYTGHTVMTIGKFVVLAMAVESGSIRFLGLDETIDATEALLVDDFHSVNRWMCRDTSYAANDGRAPPDRL